MPKTLQYIVVAVVIAALTAVSEAASITDRNSLWAVVHDQCVPDQRSTGDPRHALRWTSRRVSDRVTRCSMTLSA